MQVSTSFHFSLPAVSGETVSFDDFPDAAGFMVIFTCNHCPYAIAYEERLKDLSDTYASRGIPLIAISSNDPVKYPQDSFENMRRRAEDKGFNFPYLYDETQEVAHNYGAERTPHAYLLQKTDEKGLSLIYKGAIDDNYQFPKQVKRHYLAEKADALLQNKTGAYEETPAVGCTIKWR